MRPSVSISPVARREITRGGNPVLVDAATQAVKQWKYAPADRPTTTEVQLTSFLISNNRPSERSFLRGFALRIVTPNFAVVLR